MTAVASRPESDQEQRDPRDPEVRLGQLLDPGSIEPLHRRDGSGMFAVRGRVDGTKVVVYCSDATKMGGALGAGAAGTSWTPSMWRCVSAVR